MLICLFLLTQKYCVLPPNNSPLHYKEIYIQKSPNLAPTLNSKDSLTTLVTIISQLVSNITLKASSEKTKFITFTQFIKWAPLSLNLFLNVSTSKQYLRIVDGYKEIINQITSGNNVDSIYLIDYFLVEKHSLPTYMVNLFHEETSYKSFLFQQCTTQVSLNWKNLSTTLSHEIFLNLVTICNEPLKLLACLSAKDLFEVLNGSSYEMYKPSWDILCQLMIHKSQLKLAKKELQYHFEVIHWYLLS